MKDQVFPPLDTVCLGRVAETIGQAELEKQVRGEQRGEIVWAKQEAFANPICVDWDFGEEDGNGNAVPL